MLKDTVIHFNRLLDTVINETDCYRFEFLMQGKAINLNGEIEIRENSNRNYELMICKEDYLPRRFISYYEKKLPVWIVSYNEFNLLPIINDTIFDYNLGYSNYKKFTQEEYQFVSKNADISKVNTCIGTKASNWTLPLITGDSITLSRIKANLIMLEFWFPYCTGCVAAIPDINEIQKKYKNKGLQVFGLEFTRPDSTKLNDYISKMKIEYSTLYSAKKVASNYGVSGGPTVFLINKAGKFVYAKTGFIKEELIKAIEENIK
jgi:peroxiredoxin